MTSDRVKQAADIHRVAGALIPGYDTILHSVDAFYAFYRDEVPLKDELWGVFDARRLRGFIALRPEWIDHLYVDPTSHRAGIGSSLVRLAEDKQPELRLYTFQSNVNAGSFYGKHGFVMEELTDCARSEEKMPDVTYRWIEA